MSNADVFFGEIVGTAVLVLMGVGVVAGVNLKTSKAFKAGWVAISFGWGLGVLSGVYIVTDASGGHINPAVTLGFALDTGDWSQTPFYWAGQLIGGVFGGVAAWLAYYGHFQAELHDPEVEETVAAQRRSRTKEPGPVLGIFATVPEIRRPWQNVTTEALATMVLVLAVLRLGVNEGMQLTALDGLMVALVVVGIGLCLGGPTGYAINPARDLGPRIAHSLLPLPNKGHSDWSYAWVPVVGPMVGAVLAAAIAHIAL